MVYFDFGFFEKLYDAIKGFADQCYVIFFQATLRDAIVYGIPEWTDWGQRSLLLHTIDSSILNMPLGFGLIFGSVALLVIVSLVKWVLDIVT